MLRKKRLNNDKLYNSNAGFTLVELMVVIVMLAIVAGLTVFGILKWQDWANFKKENEYAQTLFLATQNQLTEFAVDGRLEELKEDFASETGSSTYTYTRVGLNITGLMGSITSPEGKVYVLNELFPESDGKDDEEKYQDEIVSLRAETGDYQQYLDDPEGLRETNPQAYWLFELLSSYVYDKTILNGSENSDGSGSGAAICVEITPVNGQVFSVLYSDKKDRLIYKGIGTEPKDEQSDVADIANRVEDYRKERMVGYYGVDSLYAATENKIVKPSFSSVRLHNEDTFYMTFKLSKKYRLLTNTFDYDVDLDGSRNIKDKKITAKIPAKNSAGVNNFKAEDKDNPKKNSVMCPVTVYGADGTKTEIGEFPVLVWIEEDGYTVHVIWDAADIQATTELYEADLTDIRNHSVEEETMLNGDIIKKSTYDFAKTYSFFRFGVAPGNVYASVTASGEGYITSKTATNFRTQPVAMHVVYGGGSENIAADGITAEYTIKNPRHLYNVRYIEDLSYAKQALSNGPKDQIKSVTFTMASKLDTKRDDIDWKEFQKAGQLYDAGAEVGGVEFDSINGKIQTAKHEAISDIDRTSCDFPSITQLRERDVFDGNNKTISGIAVSEISNVIYDIYTKAGESGLYDVRPAALFNVNYGVIKDLNLDRTTVFGSEMVGAFCGINAGEISNVKTLNTDDGSLITGYENVGGIMGFQLPTKSEVDILGLENNAAVEGTRAVGGIVGMVRNDFSNIDVTSLGGFVDLSNTTQELLKFPATLKVKVAECKNYGPVAGINSSELKGVYSHKKNQPETYTKPEDADKYEARYIGGIAGYCYNKGGSDDIESTEKIKIEDCISSPQYSGDALHTILSSDDELEKKLTGAYVGGIVGYNYYGQINRCSTENKKGQGYIFGYKYVGGIVGMNIGPSSGISGSTTGAFNKERQGKNQNHVIAYEYAGGITGCNANTLEKDSYGLEVPKTKDPAKMEGIFIPDVKREMNVHIDNWENNGIVIATGKYAGGITGYNAGWIYRCNTIVNSDTAETYFATLHSGDYVGGVAGYNNGIIGNTQRSQETGKKDGNTGDKFSTTCYVRGKNYIGGVVGYNDVDAIIEDYQIAGGYVLGDEGSYYVGGYAGLNSSIDLLMDMETEKPRDIFSNPNKVEGTYFVGGVIGGNIINTNGYNKKPAEPTRIPTPTPELITPTPELTPTPEATPTGTPSPEVSLTPNIDPSWVPVDGAYATFNAEKIEQHGAERWYMPGVITIYNESGKVIEGWNVYIPGEYSIEGVDRANYNLETKCFYQDDISQWNGKIDNTGTCEFGFRVFTLSEEEAKRLQNERFQVYTKATTPTPAMLNLASMTYKAPMMLARAQEPNDDYDITIEREGHNEWYSNGYFVREYKIIINNYTGQDQKALSWMLETECPVDIVLIGGDNWDSRISVNGNRFQYIQQNSSDDIKDRKTIKVQIGYKNAEDADKFINSVIRLNVDDVVVYEKNINITPTPTVSPTEEPTPSPTDDVDPTPTPDPYNEIACINAIFKTENFLGTLRGDAFVGGFIGYNILIDNKDTEEALVDPEKRMTYQVQKALIDKFDKSDKGDDANDGEITEEVKLQQKVDIVENLKEISGVDYTVSKDTRLYMSGVDSELTKSAFGTITGNIYVGGVIGYNDEKTILSIVDVENASAIVALKAIEYEKEQIISIPEEDEDSEPKYRKTDYLDRDYVYKYSYAGGIIGKVSRNTILDNCYNSYSGTVTTKGTYNGGLCEINEGTVRNCRVVAGFGSGVDDYIGGLCGLNKAHGVISMCSFENKTISGRNVVGGIVAENFGEISNVIIRNAKLTATAQASGDKDGVAGLFAGYNGDTGVIKINSNIENISVKSDGNYVGAIVGVNAGTIKNQLIAENDASLDKNIVVSGNVQGRYDVGGIIGLNKTKANVAHYTNMSTVVASDGNAGGIIGENQASWEIKYCENAAVVSATVGNAGGIVSTNDGIILSCYDYKAVTAPKGMCGGITAVNGANNVDATIRNCYVMSNDENDSIIEFVSPNSVGGVTALNYGIIENNVLANVRVTNNNLSMRSRIGVIAGENGISGRIYIGSNEGVTNCSAIAKTNYCNVGGVAGINAGLIANKNSFEEYKKSKSIPLDVEYGLIGAEVKLEGAQYGSLGGVTGTNTGTIAFCQVDEIIEGVLGDYTIGYGGIAGFSGYVSSSKYKEGISAKEAQASEYFAGIDADDYRANIIGCSFDGDLHAQGSAGSPANVGGIAGINGYGGYISDCGIGVRMRDIAGNVTDASKKTYITSGDLNKTVDAADNVAYAYLGGIAGRNYAEIRNINMYGFGIVEASDRDPITGVSKVERPGVTVDEDVFVLVYGGTAGGVVGFNYEDGIVSGYVDKGLAGNEIEHWITTPDTMRVEMRRGENDYGSGGVIGYDKSPADIAYIKNYADVENLVSTNVKTGGVIGTLEQQITPIVNISHLENYGYIYGRKQAGGIIARTKFCSVDMSDCVNYGKISAIDGTAGAAGGLIGAIYDVQQSEVYFTNCANHGEILANNTISDTKPKGVGGLIGCLNTTTDTKVYFYNCDNTGVILSNVVTKASDGFTQCFGSFVGNPNGSTNTLYFDLCQNYNTSKSTNGFVPTSCMVHFTNCLDNSGQTTFRSATLKSIVSPFAGETTRQGVNSVDPLKSTFQSVYYLAKDSNDTSKCIDSFDGAYFTISRYNGFNYYQQGNKYINLNNPKMFLSTPSKNNLMMLDNNKNIEMHVSYDGAKCSGMKAFNVYLWDGKTDSGTANIVNTANITFTDINGVSETVTGRLGSVSYDFEAGKISCAVPDSLDSHIVDIKINLVVSSGYVYLRGFSYDAIKTDGSITESACKYLSDKYDIAFNLNPIDRIEGVTIPNEYSTFNDISISNRGFQEMEGYTKTVDINDTVVGKKLHKYFANDMLGIKLTNGELITVTKTTANEPVKFTFDVSNGEKSTGIDAFVFYPASKNTSATTELTTRMTYKYDYSVKFTDEEGSESVFGQAIGYDIADCVNNDELKNIEIVSVPENIDSKKIKKIELTINDSIYTKYNSDGVETAPSNLQNKVYLRGFAWIPSGSAEPEYMPFGKSINNTFNLDNMATNYYITKLYCDYSVNGTADIPYVYPETNYANGFKPTANDPINDTYYNDVNVYEDSDAFDNGSDSRIKVYKDLSTQFEAWILKNYTKKYKLDTPKPTVTTKLGRYYVTWDAVPNAYEYEIKYELIDANNNVVKESAITTNAAGNREHIIFDSPEFAGKQIKFYVRAVNGYRYTCGPTETDKYRYDSDWEPVEETIITKKALPMPEVHIELTSANKMVAVLDNRDDYMDGDDFIDCVINVRHGITGKSMGEYIINVAESNVSSNAVYEVTFLANKDKSIGDDIDINAQAIPNETVADYYMESDGYYRRGHIVDNAYLVGDPAPVANKNLSTNVSGTLRYIDTTIYRGFYGTDADDMTYDIYFDVPKGRDCYLLSDIVSFDERIGANVSYSNMVTHTAAVDANAKFIATLSNLPMEWFAEDFKNSIIVRNYLKTGQFDIVQYQHLVADNIRFEGETPEENQGILAEIIDPYYINVDDEGNVSIDEEYCIWDADNNCLRPGYTLQRVYSEDGEEVYEVYYNASIELAEKEGATLGEDYPYYKYCVDYKLYTADSLKYEFEGDGTAADIVYANINKDDYQESYLVRNRKEGTVAATGLPKPITNTKVQELQPAPIINDDFVESVDENGHRSLKFSFDKYYRDVYCMSKAGSKNGNTSYTDSSVQYITVADYDVATTWEKFASITDFANVLDNETKMNIMNAYYYSYKNAKYRVELIGTTIDGDEAIIAKQLIENPNKLDDITNNYQVAGETINAKYELFDYEAEFTDVDDVWNNYSDFKVRVMRLGELNGITNVSGGPGKITKITSYEKSTFRLPRYSEYKVHVKMRLNSINTPSVALHQDGQGFETDDLIYDVKFGAITNEKQLEDLGGYLITAKLKAEDGNGETEDHYYYVLEDGVDDDNTSDDIKELLTKPNVTKVDKKINYVVENDTRKVIIDLSDFNSDDVVEITVVAFTKADAVNYQDAIPGEGSDVKILPRLLVPFVNKLVVDDTHGMGDVNEIVDKETYQSGLYVKYDTDNEAEKYTDEVRMSIATAIFESEDDSEDYKKHMSGDAVVDEATSQDPDDNSWGNGLSAVWNEGAIATIYSKANEYDLGMIKNADKWATISKEIMLSDTEEYVGQYAGNWLKLALKATSKNKINSAWTDQDAETKSTLNYKWIKLPKLQLPDIDIASDSSEYYEQIYAEEKVHNKTLEFAEEKNQTGYAITVVGKEESDSRYADSVTPVYQIYIEQHKVKVDEKNIFDGSWDVFIAAANSDTQVKKAKDNIKNMTNVPACEQNVEAVYVGNVGTLLSSMEESRNEDSAPNKLLEFEDIAVSLGAVDKYDMNAKLCYISNGRDGRFQFVLPDITAIDNNEIYEDAEGYFAIMDVIIEPYMADGIVNHIAGDAARYCRTSVTSMIANGLTSEDVSEWMSANENLFGNIEHTSVPEGLLGYSINPDETISKKKSLNKVAIKDEIPSEEVSNEDITKSEFLNKETPENETTKNDIFENDVQNEDGAKDDVSEEKTSEEDKQNQDVLNEEVLDENVQNDVSSEDSIVSEE